VEVAKLKSYWLEKLAALKPHLHSPVPRKLITERCCIVFDHQECFLVHVNHRPEKIEILHAQRCSYAELPDIFIKKNLNQVPIFLQLPVDDYHIFLIESLLVPDNELLAALNWRIRSLIAYPVTDALVDYFKIPSKHSSIENPMIAAVVVKKSHIESLLEKFSSVGLSITTIDIPEMAMRNLCTLYDMEEKSVALIAFFEKTVILNIAYKKTIYFTRKIPFTAEMIADQYEAFCLELLRYFDYFQTKWRTPSPKTVWMVSAHQDPDEIIKKMNQQVSISIEKYPLKKVLEYTKNNEAFDERFLLALGGALREEVQYVSAGN
jgi:MSHA biogenesis protein MshI